MDDVKDESLLRAVVEEYVSENHKGWRVCDSTGYIFHPMRGYVQSKFMVGYIKTDEHRCIHVCDGFVAEIFDYHIKPEGAHITNCTEHDLLEKIGISITRISAK